MIKYRIYILHLITVFLIISCTPKIIKNNPLRNYLPYSEVLNIKHVKLTNSKIKSKINNFIDETIAFENGVNSYSPYKIKYYVLIEGICRNDSSLLVLRALAGSYLFYGHSNDLDERILDQFRLTYINGNSVLIASDIKEAFCTPQKEIFKESMENGKFDLNWYKDENGDWLIDFYPYFYRTYYLNSDSIESIEYEFPDRIQNVKK